MTTSDEPNDQRELERQDPETGGGDSESVASVEEREAVARDDDELFEDADDAEE